MEDLNEYFLLVSRVEDAYASVAQDDLSGLDDKGKLAADAVSIALVLLGGHCI